MDDDDSSRANQSKRRTSSQGEEPGSDSDPGPDEATRQYNVDQETLKSLREQSGSLDATLESDETAELRRDEILEKVSRDRPGPRNEPSTIPVEAIETDDGDAPTDVREAETRRMEKVGDDGATVETTFEPPVEEDDDETTMEFPARVEPNLKLSVPAEEAAKAGLEPGDLIVVTIEKIDG